MYNPNVDYVTNVSPNDEDSPMDNAQKHIKYIYWILFVILIVMVSTILYAYLKGVPVKVK